jgi:hypothetical protein
MSLSQWIQGERIGPELVEPWNYVYDKDQNRVILEMQAWFETEAKQILFKAFSLYQA